jgi:hypothetical protein
MDLRKRRNRLANALHPGYLPWRGFGEHALHVDAEMPATAQILHRLCLRFQRAKNHGDRLKFPLETVQKGRAMAAGRIFSRRVDVQGNAA